MNSVRIVSVLPSPSAPAPSPVPCGPVGLAGGLPSPLETDGIAFREIDFGRPMRMRALPRSVSAPRRLPSGKTSSAFLTSASKRSRNSFCGVFRSGSRRAQKSAMNFSASWSEAIFFHSFLSSSVARYAYSGDFSQSLYLSRAARDGNAATVERRSRERAIRFERLMGDSPAFGRGLGSPASGLARLREYTSTREAGFPHFFFGGSVPVTVNVALVSAVFFDTSSVIDTFRS